jgi:Skp family chaperone for outer membrane proteins
MSTPRSQEASAKSSPSWKVVAVMFIILTIEVSGVAYYYYAQTQTKVSGDASLNAQIQQMQTWLNGNKTQIGNLQTQLDTTGKLNAAQTLQLQQANSQIADLQARLASLQASYSTLLSQNGSLTSVVAGLQSSLHSLTLQAGNLTMIVNLQDVVVIANSVTINWASCGETGQPSCRPSTDLTSQRYIYPPEFTSICSSTCYAGYVKGNWTSTEALNLFFMFTINSRTSTTISSSGSTGTTAIPFPGTGTFVAGFQNDACFYDNFNNLHCPGGTLTYSATYVY